MSFNWGDPAPWELQAELAEIEGLPIEPTPLDIDLEREAQRIQDYAERPNHLRTDG